MIEQDTVRLLRECDAGIKMGVTAIDDVLDHVTDRSFKALLVDSKNEHEKLKNQLEEALQRFHDEGKNPNPMAQGMTRMKTGMKINFDGSDNAIADIMTDGCNMGVKSLHRYLNKYKAADESAKNITKQLVNIEERLAVDMRHYL